MPLTAPVTVCPIARVTPQTTVIVSIYVPHHTPYVIVPLIGSTDISSIGDGTITSAIKTLNNNISYLPIGKGSTTSFTYYKSAIFIVFRDSISEIYAFDVYGNTMPVAGTSSNYLECSTSGADGTGNKEITVSLKNNTGAMACGILILL